MLATILCMKIPEDMKKQITSLRKKHHELKEMKTNISRSSLPNVVDLNDEIIHVAGDFCSQKAKLSQQIGVSSDYISGEQIDCGGTLEDEKYNLNECDGRQSPIFNYSAPMQHRSNSGVSESAKEDKIVCQGCNNKSQVECGSQANDEGINENEEYKFSSKPNHCCQYRNQMKYILHELQCLSNKVHGDAKKEDIKRYVASPLIYNELIIYFLII